MSVIELPEFWIGIAVVCMVTWLVLVGFSKRTAQQESRTEIERFVDKSLVVQRSGAMEQAGQFDIGVLEKRLRALTARSNSDSYISHYVRGLIERSKTQVDIENLKKAIEVVGVRVDLVNKLIEAKQTEYRMHRIDQEEAIKDEQLKTQLLQEQAEQERLQDEMGDQREIRNLESKLKIRKLEKELADLDKEPTEAKPKPKPSPEELFLYKLAKQKEIKEAIQAEESEELLAFRLAKRPDPAKEKRVYEDESVWLAEWREIGGDQADQVMSDYENIKKRYRKLLDDALAEFG